MKLSRTSWLLLTAGIIVVAFTSLGVARYQQYGEESRLADELIVAETRLEKFDLKELSAQQKDLEVRLNEANTQLNTAKGALRQSLDSIEITDTLFQIATASDVVITGVSQPGISSGKLGNVNCSAARLSIFAQGDVLHLIDFVIRLNTDFPTGIVESVEIAMPDETSEGTGETEGETEGETGGEEVAEEGTTGSTANIRLVIYSYQGG